MQIWGFLLASALALSAFGHAVVRPPQSVIGQTEQYTLRVPNEKQISTTKIELAFPAEIRVTQVDAVAGWKLEVSRDSQGRIVAATWTGSLAPATDVQFTFLAQNPATPVEVEWRVVQTFEDASRSEWTGPPGSKTPASHTKINSAEAPK